MTQLDHRTGAKIPGASRLIAIANAASVSMDWLAGRPGIAREDGDKHIIVTVSAGMQEATGLVPVPLYEVEAGAGNIRLVESVAIGTWLWISRPWADRLAGSSLAPSEPLVTAWSRQSS